MPVSSMHMVRTILVWEYVHIQYMQLCRYKSSMHVCTYPACTYVHIQYACTVLHTPLVNKFHVQIALERKAKYQSGPRAPLEKPEEIV